MEFVRRLRISGKRRSYHRRLAPESRLGIKVQFAFFCHWQQEKMVIVRAMEREDIKKNQANRAEVKQLRHGHF